MPNPNEDLLTNIIATQEIQDVETHLNKNPAIDMDLIAEVKKMVTAEIVAELKEDKVLEEKERQIRQEQEDIEYNKYVARMKESPEPWVDFIGQVRDTAQGQRLQMDWNSAFIEYLKASGITGVDEEQIMQKYISMLLRDMSDKYEERYGSDYE